MPAQRFSVIPRMRMLLRPYWKHVVGIVLLALFSVGLSLLMPLPLKVAVDSAIGNHPLSHWLASALPGWASSTRGARLGVAVAMLIGIVILSNLQTLASWILQTYVGERLVLDLRSLLFWHAQRMQLSSYERRGALDVSYRIQHDAPALQFIFLQGILPLLTSVLMFAGMVIVSARIDWQITAVALGLTPILLLLARHTGIRVRSRYEDVRKLDSAAMVVLQEALTGLRVVKAFGQEAFEHARFHMRSRERMVEQLKLASAQASGYLAVTMITGIGSAAALYLGVHHVLSGVITTGELLIVLAYVAQLYDPLKTISGKVPEMQLWLVSISRAFVLLEDAPEPADDGTLNGMHIRGEVEFRKVSFHYQPGRWALREVSFHVPAGARVGIVGASGSGKTTLVNLLARFYDVTDGAILLDGRDLREYGLAALRQQIAILPQEPMLFSGSVAQNIAYARPEASRAEITAAAEAANAHEFIAALPQGYDTKIGEGAWRLSVGQGQRIAIARAFLKRAPIVILDEPTSALDVHTEREIMAVTSTLLHGRTAFIIAHRLNTVRDCDLLLVMEGGRLVTVSSEVQSVLDSMLHSGGVDRVLVP